MGRQFISGYQIQLDASEINYLIFRNCDAIFINILANTQTHACTVVSHFSHYIHLHYAESMSTHSFTLTNIITCRYSHITEPAHTHIDTQAHSLTLGAFVWCRFRFFSLLLLLFFSSPFFLVVCRRRRRRWIPCIRSFVGRSVRSCVHNDECWFMHSLRVFCVIVIIANSSSIRLMQKPHQHP